MTRPFTDNFLALDKLMDASGAMHQHIAIPPLQTAGAGEPRTLFDKLWQSHLVEETGEGESLLYIDRQLVYEVTSPQAFEGLRMAGRRPWRPETVIAAADHNVPTEAAERGDIDAVRDPLARIQIRQLETNCRDFGITHHGLESADQGIIHVIGPEQAPPCPE